MMKGVDNRAKSIHCPCIVLKSLFYSTKGYVIISCDKISLIVVGDETRILQAQPLTDKEQEEREELLTQVGSEGMDLFVLVVFVL